MPTVDVVVVKTPKGYVVRPAYVVVQGGDRIVWHNLTYKDPNAPAAGEAIEVRFPSGSLDQPEGPGDFGSFSLVVPRALPGLYPYSVYSQRARDFCVGESTPGVIIKR